VAHSQTANGGLLHAQARKALRHGTGTAQTYVNARQSAFGRGVILTSDGKIATAPKAAMPEAHAYNRKGDVRCPECRHVNKSVRDSPHTCENCPAKFRVVFQG